VPLNLNVREEPTLEDNYYMKYWSEMVQKELRFCGLIWCTKNFTTFTKKGEFELSKTILSLFRLDFDSL
jgi:hypothetical protein